MIVENYDKYEIYHYSMLIMKSRSVLVAYWQNWVVRTSALNSSAISR